MDISDVRINLVNDSTDRLKAFCSVTLDAEFVIRDIKIVEGANGLFVAMPSRKLSASCPKCKHKNPLRARYCSDCGAGLPDQEVPTDEAGRAKLYRDIAHPITTSFREKLQKRVVAAYEVAREEAPDADDRTAGHYDAQEDDGVDQEGGRGEYDDIIADLRSPAGSEQSKARDRGRREPQPSSERASSERPSSERPPGDRPRRRRRRGRERRPRADEETPKPEPEPVVASDAVVGENEETAEPVSIEPVSIEPVSIEPVFAAESSPEVAEKTEAPPSIVSSDREADEVSLTETAEAPAPAEDTSEDTTPFGIGIT